MTRRAGERVRRTRSRRQCARRAACGDAGSSRSGATRSFWRYTVGPCASCRKRIRRCRLKSPRPLSPCSVCRLRKSTVRGTTKAHTAAAATAATAAAAAPTWRRRTASRLLSIAVYPRVIRNAVHALLKSGATLLCRRRLGRLYYDIKLAATLVRRG